MRFLLDTHVFLWFVLNDPKLSEVALNTIINPAHEILISPASYWEIAIKVSIGKYDIPGDFNTWMEHHITLNHFEILPILIAHTATVATLPFHHKDPFDRLLVAQALTERIPIISADAILDAYSVTRIG
jgi:PIN domain nuclease of toxin-antitoxin system